MILPKGVTFLLRAVGVYVLAQALVHVATAGTGLFMVLYAAFA